MFARAIMRSCLRTTPLRTLRTPTSRLSRNILQTPARQQQPFSLSTSYKARTPWPIPPRKSPQPWVQPDYRAGVRSAKPLITTEQLRRMAQRPQTKIIGAVLVAGGLVFYVANIEEVPISGRKRFNCYSEESVEQEGQRMYAMIMQQNGGAVLPAWDSRSKMVQRVMKRLIQAEGLGHVDWEVNVIQSNGE